MNAGDVRLSYQDGRLLKKQIGAVSSKAGKNHLLMSNKQKPNMGMWGMFMLLITIFIIVSQCWWNNNKSTAIGPIPQPTCDEAQDHIIDVDCQEFFMIPGFDSIWGTDDDISFLVFCESIQNSGVATLDLRCVVSANTCAEIEECLHAND